MEIKLKLLTDIDIDNIEVDMDGYECSLAEFILGALNNSADDYKIGYQFEIVRKEER